MAAAMNPIGYDAAALGNHEFNYGIDTAAHVRVAAATSRCSAPTPSTRPPAPVFPPYVIKTVQVAAAAATVKVGILGLTNPGIAIWDKANVEGRIEFPGLVEQAKVCVPRAEARWAATSSSSPPTRAPTPRSSYGDALPYPENASDAGRRAGARHRRDPGRPRARRDPAAARHQHGDRQAGAAVRAATTGACGWP